MSRWRVIGVIGLLMLAAWGCARKTNLPQIRVETASSESVEIALSEPKASWRNADTVAIEVSYRFTRGQPVPDESYDLLVSFQGTPHVGVKPMRGRQLQIGGKITDTFFVSKPDVKSFALQVAETETELRRGHKRLSNVVTGEIQP